MDSPSHSNDFDSLLKLSSFINLLKSIDLPSSNPPPPHSNWSSILQPSPEPLKPHPKRHSFLPEDLTAPNSPPNLSKTLQNLAKSDHQKLQEKHEKLCLHLEELVECLPSIISAFQTLDCLKNRLDNTVHKISKTLTEANKVTYDDLTFHEKKRIKTVRPRELDMNIINKEKGSLSKPSVQFMTPQYKPESRFDFSFKNSQQPQPKMSPAMKYMETAQVITEENFLKETEDSREFSFFETSFEEVDDQKIEVLFTKKERLVSSDKFEVASVSLKCNNNGEIHGFLIKRAQQDLVLFFAPPVDEWLNLKVIIKTGGDKPVEDLLLPLMEKNVIYKVESCDVSGSLAYFTPLHKN